MHAIVRQGDGKFYVSAVFGYYRDITATDDYQRYLEGIYKPYWIVWDEDKKRLIRWLDMVPNTKYIIPQILIIDSNQDNWNMDENGVGCVDFLSRELLDSFLDEEQQPEEILSKCRGVITCTVAMMGSFGPVVALASLSNNLNQTLASGERVLSVLEEKPLVMENHGESKPSVFTGAELMDVTFAYDEDVILKKYNLQADKGQIVGIHGASGSGKVVFEMEKGRSL